MRTFAAVPVAEPAAVAALAGAQAQLRRAGGRVRWVAPHQFHFTLKFFGNLAPDQVQAAGRALAQAAAAAAPFALELSGLGAFPRPESARVIWAGCAGGRAELEALAAAAEAALVAAGFVAEARRFSAHLTLGRLGDGGPGPELAQAVRAAAGRPFGRVPVDRIVLYRSDLRPAGPVYTVQAQFPLGK